MKEAVCALIFIEGKIVMISRKDNHNDFGLPGGKVDEGESLEQAIIREVREELGREFIITKKVFSADDGCGYLTTTFTGVLGEEQLLIHKKETGIVKEGTWNDLFAGSFVQYNKKLFSSVVD